MSGQGGIEPTTWTFPQPGQPVSPSANPDLDLLQTQNSTWPPSVSPKRAVIDSSHVLLQDSPGSWRRRWWSQDRHMSSNLVYLIKIYVSVASRRRGSRCVSRRHRIVTKDTVHLASTCSLSRIFLCKFYTSKRYEELKTPVYQKYSSLSSILLYIMYSNMRGN